MPLTTARRRPATPRPTLWWLRSSWKRLAGAVMAVGLMALLVFVFADDRFYVQGAQIDGQYYTSPAEIYDLAGVHGYSVFWVDAGEVARRIEALPYVKQAQVRPLLPGRVQIHVEERQPVAVWQVDGRDYWVDLDGVTMPVASELVGLPRLIDREGSSVDQVGGVDTEIVQAVLELRRQLPEVDQFAYDRNNGLHFTLPGGTLVYLGQPQGLAGRVALMKTLQETLVAQGELPAEINFRHDGGFYYRPAPAN